MEIRSSGFDAQSCTAVNASLRLTPSAFADPLIAPECFIEKAETEVREGGNVKYVDTEVDMSLKEYRYMLEEAQKKGRKEAWDLARRLISSGSDCYTYDEACDLFDTKTYTRILGMPVEEALSIDKEYQEEKKKLHIGDEVEFWDGSVTITAKGYVVNIISPEIVRVLTKKYGTCTMHPEKCKKTGKHSKEIEKAMASFEEESKNDDI